MGRLRLVITLLTTLIFIKSVFTAPISPNTSENATTTTTATQILSKSSAELTPSTFIVPEQTSLNTSIPPPKVDDYQQMKPTLVETNERLHVEFEGETESDDNEGESKIETRTATGEAPVINLAAVEPIKEPTQILSELPVGDDNHDDIGQNRNIDDEDNSEMQFESSTASSPNVDDDDVASDMTLSTSPSTITSTTSARDDVVVIVTSETTTTTKATPIATESDETKDSDDTDDDESISVDDEDSTSSIHEASATTPPATAADVTTTFSTKMVDRWDFTTTALINTTQEPYKKLRDDDNTTDRSSKPFNGDIYPIYPIYPMTFWDRVSRFTNDFVYEHRTLCFIMMYLLFSIAVILIFLVVKECCKDRFRYRSNNRRHFVPSVTADLYNTSTSSHFYTKPTLLPNQQEVTMQLVSSDVSTDDIV